MSVKLLDVLITKPQGYRVFKKPKIIEYLDKETVRIQDVLIKKPRDYMVPS